MKGNGRFALVLFGKYFVCCPDKIRACKRGGFFVVSIEKRHVLLRTKFQLQNLKVKGRLAELVTDAMIILKLSSKGHSMSMLAGCVWLGL
jgi:hypothetical protein